MKALLVKLKVLLPIYILFIVSAVLFHSYFLLSGAYFVENCCDSLKQISYFQVFLQRFFDEGFQMWSWNYGIGGDVFGQFIYYYTTSPFYWITSIVTSIQNLQDIFEIRIWVSVAKLLLTMIFMFHFLKYFNRTIFASILGSLIYAGSTYFTFHSLRYDFLVDGMVFLPLLLLGFERYAREEKKGLFLFSVFLTVCSNFYLAFMNSLFLGMYMVFSYFYNCRTLALKDFSLHAVRFAGLYLIGLLLASFSFLPAVFNFTQVDRFFYELNLPLFFNPNFYQALPYEFLFMTTRYQFVASLPIISFFLLLTAILVRKHLPVFIFTLIVLLLTILPFTYSMFNGFSSVQFRWLYLVIFVVAFSSSFVLDNLHTIKIRHWTIIGFLGMTIMLCTIVFKRELIEIYANQYDIMILTIAAGTILLLIGNSFIPKKVFSFLLIGLTIFNLTYTNHALFNKFLGDSDAFVNRQQDLLDSSNYGLDTEEKLFNHIQKEDSSFYRIVWNDQQEINAPLLYNFNGMSAYNSMLDGNVHRFFKTDMNTLQQNAPSMFKNADNRIYIETLLNTKYYVMNRDSPYIPPGYDRIMENENLLVLRNQDTLPIGFIYPSYMTKQQFDSLTISQKDEVLLSTIVMEDSIELIPEFNMNNLDAYTEEIKLEDIQLENATIKDKMLTVKSFNGLTIPLQLPQGDGELKVEIGIQKTNGDKYIMTANDKTFSYNGDNNTYSYPQDKVVFNLMNTVDTNEVRIELTPGEYQLDSVKIHYNSYERFKKLINERSKESLQHVKIEKNRISGDIKSEENGIMFMSVPYSIGWHVKVDGETVKPFKVHGTFIGIPINKGTHKVEMNFRSPFLLEGFILSLITLFGLVVWFFWKKKNKRNE